MAHAAAVEKGKRAALFLMLIMGAVLHGISVADIYLPALRKAGSVLMEILR